MQLRFRVSRSTSQCVQRLLPRRTPACLVALSALAGSACSGDYAIGDLSEGSLPISGGAESGPTGGADTRVEPFLEAPEVTLTWETFGGMTAAVGDVDGDGYDDFAVSSLDTANLTAYVHLRYGGPDPLDSEDAFALAESGARLVFEENSPLIQSIDAAGDVNGDGFADMLVTAMVCQEALSGGGAHLLYGGPDRLEGVHRIGEAATHLTLPVVNAGLGNCDTPTAAPLGIGDVDGDGFDDFMLVHYQSPDSQDPSQLNAPTRTRAYLFYGRAEALASNTTWFDADAVIVADQFFRPFPVGDVTADQRDDFALGGELASYYWVPGSATRLSGEVDADATFAELACADGPCGVPPVERAGDVDGDGVDDVLVYEAHNRAHLFYGASGLLDDGLVDLEDAAARFIDDFAQPRELLFSPAGDRDGDGDADLLSLFYSDEQGIHADVAFVSGSSKRLDGPQDLPIQSAIAERPGGLPFAVVFEQQSQTVEQPSRVLVTATDAGDLNGDGASDLLTTSMYLERVDETGLFFSNEAQQLHIHYGTPGGTGTTPSVY